jgi:transcriptional regulator with XRE-family HTH domain
MELFIDIGARLREEREALGKSQSEIAAIAAAAGVPGTTRQSQARYEKGLQMPSAAYLAAIATAGIDVLYILTGNNQEVTDQSNRATSPDLPADEQLLLDAYRGLNATKKKQLLASLLTGDVAKKPAKSGGGVVVSGSGNKTAGRDYHE